MRSLAISLALFTNIIIAPQPGASGSGCGDTRYPPELPQPSALVDSANAIANLAAFARTSKAMEFSLVFPDGDSVPSIRGLNGTDGAAAVALAHYVRRQPPSQMWAIRVHIAGGDTPALTLARSEYCPPLPRTPIVPATVMSTIARPGQLGPPSVPASAIFEALIASDGYVREARVIQASTEPRADEQTLERLRRQRFHPARLDGAPVEAWWRSATESPRP